MKKESESKNYNPILLGKVIKDCEEVIYRWIDRSQKVSAEMARDALIEQTNALQTLDKRNNTNYAEKNNRLLILFKIDPETLQPISTEE